MRSRWRSGSRIVCISSLSITSPSACRVFFVFVDAEVRNRYHLKDVIVGKIYFLLVRIKIKHMELSIIRRETTGAPPNQYNESETITKFEIMDGAPVRGLFCFFFFLFFPVVGLNAVMHRGNDSDPAVPRWI